ncbi:MAG: helix-turn-helix domain-containing protein [Deltaproteobacteria bacterium]|nr:helix-turn-helix domain-containing protein [Deltaproteobacteria bacterium]
MPDLETNQTTRRPSLKELLSRGDLISPEELAAALRVARITTYKWASRGVIPHLKLEGVVRFDPQDIAAWLKENHRTAPYSEWPKRNPKGRAARNVPSGGPCK